MSAIVTSRLRATLTMARARTRTAADFASSDDFYRAALAILPKVASGGVRIILTEGPRGQNQYTVVNSGKRDQARDNKLDAALVETLVRHRLLTVQDGAVSISDEAQMWLRRRKSGAEPFREQHQIRRDEKREISGSLRPVVVNEGESPLGWLRRRKDRDGVPLLSAAQFEAGERLRSDYERAQLRPGVTSSWDGLASTRKARRGAPDAISGLQESAIAARGRVEEALGAVGPELAGVLVDVCCHLDGLSETERNNGWPQRSGKIILQMALTRLARHYGIDDSGSNNEHRKTARIRHWGTDGFRPTLQQWRD